MLEEENVAPLWNQYLGRAELELRDILRQPPQVLVLVKVGLSQRPDFPMAARPHHAAAASQTLDIVEEEQRSDAVRAWEDTAEAWVRWSQ